MVDVAVEIVATVIAVVYLVGVVLVDVVCCRCAGFGCCCDC